MGFNSLNVSIEYNSNKKNNTGSMLIRSDIIYNNFKEIMNSSPGKLYFSKARAYPKDKVDFSKEK
jgi:hypothetical protein